MLKLMKYLKPAILSILMVIGLLVVQAACDLALPDYMSNIVNVGIQQGGIENAVPQAIRKSEAEKLFLFMDDQQVDTFLKHYTLYQPGDTSQKDYSRFAKDYPLLDKEPIYGLNTKDKDTISTLNELLPKPMLVVYGIENNMFEGMGQQMPEGADPFKVLGKLPKEQLSAMREQIDEKFSALSESMSTQTAIEYIKSEYQALGADVNNLQVRYLFWAGVSMLLITLLSMAATILVGFLASRVSAAFGRDLRLDTFKKIESFSNYEFDKYSTASLITRTTNDIQQVQMFTIMMLRMVFYAPIVGVGGVFKVLSTNTNMGWILAVAVMVILAIVLIMFGVAIPKFKTVQKLVDRLNLVTRESLTGLLVIRAFNTQKHEEERFDKANSDLTRVNLFINRTMALMMPLMMLVMNGITILIVWVGAHQVDTGVMQVGDMMAFIQYTMQIIFSFLIISFVSIILPRASVSAQRISEVLAVEPVIVDPEHPKSFDPNTKGILEFKNVSFRYPGAEDDVLSNISFTAQRGQTTAFIGSTGSGKSTLINLIPRFYDVTEGQILLDGVDIREVTQHDLRQKIGYVPQKGSLFSGTIESNLKYGDENASEEQLKKAAEIAQAMEFISSKPLGFEEPIAQGGTNVSGGQKQRLSIARALVKKPEIYIFDDSFSALDFKTDSALRKALKSETTDSIVLIVAQRVSTIMNADQIIVLEDGKIAGKGKHQELLKNCEVYREIASSQLSKEELAV
jgi:ATP-binding cassette subfamily B protein